MHIRSLCRLPVIAVQTLLLIFCTGTAMASSSIKLEQSPKTMLSVSQGLWSGDAIMVNNGHTISHTVRFCVRHPHRFISEHTGAQLYGGYYPPTCKVKISANTQSLLSFREVCVPPQYIHTIIAHPSRFSALADLPAYLSKRYDITSDKNGIIRVRMYTSEKYNPATSVADSNVMHKNDPSAPPKYISKSINGFFHYVSNSCPRPIKVPTNKELRAEGKTVKSNHYLSKKLKSKLGYNPFKNNQQQN